MRLPGIILFLLTTVYGCAPTLIKTTWSQANRYPESISRMLIAVVLPEKDSTLRKAIELQLSADINSLGYQAIASSDEFGQHGLLFLGKEETYVALCERGIDAVITVALIDEEKARRVSADRNYNYTNLGYFNRIWDYKNYRLQQNMPAYAASSNEHMFESFLFDLKTLQPIYFSRTQAFRPSQDEELLKEYAKVIFKHMVKKRILVRRPNIKAA